LVAFDIKIPWSLEDERNQSEEFEVR